ncbi:MAG: peptidase S41 [Chitinophagaceae bacterium]|nr:peptidase S41 [Chitinophagaceae bacterium]
MSNWHQATSNIHSIIGKGFLKNKLLVAYCLLHIALLFTSCGVSKSSFSPYHKFSPQELQKDYTIYQSVLESHHPGLYWYTSKDSMDHYFNWGREQLKDSMTEPQFKKILNYVTAQINCGHTTVRSSKAFNSYLDTTRLGKMFPLTMKVWDEAMVVTGNLNRRDSILTRGTVITKINGRTKDELVDTMFANISTDGYNRTHKYQTLSNRGFFGSIYTNLFGISDTYTFDYIDSTGQSKTITIPAYKAIRDTSQRTGIRPFRPTLPQPSKKERRRQAADNVRLLKIDTASQTAMMDLASFGKGYELKKFFKNSFKALQKNNIKYLIIDVRSNGGGSVTNSTFISRFIAAQQFKISDSLYAIKKGGPYQRYIQNHFWNNLFITFLTKKKKDGNYHFGFFERHYFKPKKSHHFDGKVYVLTGGNSFSATTLFVNSIIKQENVIVVGEETGGGAYGNSAWLIPDVKLPETGLRFRLPLFRLVTDKNIPKNGRGVQPEVFTPPTVEDVKKGTDYKLDKALELINKDKAQQKN